MKSASNSQIYKHALLNAKMPGQGGLKFYSTEIPDVDISKYQGIIVGVYGGDVEAFLRDANEVKPTEFENITAQLLKSSLAERKRWEMGGEAEYKTKASNIWDSKIKEKARQRQLAQQYQKQAEENNRTPVKPAAPAVRPRQTYAPATERYLSAMQSQQRGGTIGSGVRQPNMPPAWS